MVLSPLPVSKPFTFSPVPGVSGVIRVGTGLMTCAWNCRVNGCTVAAEVATCAVSSDRCLLPASRSTSFGSSEALLTSMTSDLSGEPGGLSSTARSYATGYPSENLNPPLLLPLFGLLSVFPVVAVLQAWRVISLGLYALSAFLLSRLYPVSLRRWLWISPSPDCGTRSSSGKSTLLWACWRPDFGSLCSGISLPLAVVLLGLMVAIKPNFGLMPVLLFLSGQRRVAVRSLFAAGVFSLIPRGAIWPVDLRSMAHGPDHGHRRR